MLKFAFFIIGYISLTSSGAFAGQIRSLNKLTGELSMGGGFGQVGVTCLTFAGLLSAKDFFLQLRTKNTPTGLEYWTSSQRVTKFPSELTVTVLTYLATCADSTGTDDPPSPRKVLSQIQWTAMWKTGMKTREANKIEVTENEASPDELQKRIGAGADHVRQSPRIAAWTVTLRLRGEDAPLSDSLVVIARTREGKQLARFSAHL